MIGRALTLIATLVFWMLAAASPGHAQTARVYRVGVLHGATAAATPQNFEARVAWALVSAPTACG